MFSEELKQLIEASLVDGVLTQEERGIIVKRAIAEGNDPAEVNLLLDAEVQKIKQKRQANAPKINKCPACGEMLPAFTGICPSCGYDVSKDNQNKELNELIEQINLSMTQLKSGRGNAGAIIASLEGYRRRAQMLFGENPKVQALIAEVNQDITAFKQEQERRMQQQAEMQRYEAQARIQALKGSAGGNSLSFQNNKGCYTGCLVALAVLVILCLIGMCVDSDTEEKVDQQYNALVHQLDSMKAIPLTIENYEQRENAIKDLIWTTIDEYSSYEKTKKETFDKLWKNYTEQLSTFYALHNEEIDAHCGYVLHDFSDLEKEKDKEE